MYNGRTSSTPEVSPQETKPVIGQRRPIVKGNINQPVVPATYTHISPPMLPTPVPRYHQHQPPAQYVYEGQHSSLLQFGQFPMHTAAATAPVPRHMLTASNGHTSIDQNVPASNSLYTFQDMSAEIHHINGATSTPQLLTPPTTEVNQSELDSDSDDDSNDGLTHPNKFPVEIEYHENQYCVYKRQPTRSGPKVKQRKSTVYNPTGPTLTGNEVQQVKYYQKDLVRICRCGKYNQMDGALVHGRANDCDGYEIHYSQKCKWKAYDDYKTGKRVLIRLCKCYKPML